MFHAFFAFLLLSLASTSAEEEGLRIARLTEEANNGFQGEYSEMEMILINAHGDQTVRRMITQTMEVPGDGDRSISTFEWPADVKGTRMLTWSHKTGSDDQWLFLPAIKRVKRISTRNQAGAFMGSEFSYEDLGSQEVEEFTHTFLEEVTLDERTCWLLERRPVDKKSGYSKERVWMDQEYKNPLRIEYYDRRGELLKVATFSRYTRYDTWWRADRIIMENVQTGKKSELNLIARSLGQVYDEETFSSDGLAD